MAILELGEWLPDQAEVNLPGLLIAENAVPTHNGYNSMEGFDPTELVLPDTCRGVWRGRMTGVTWFAAGTENTAHYTVGGTFTDVTPVGLTGLALDHRWTFNQFEGATEFIVDPIIIALAGKNNPPYVNLNATSATQLTKLSDDASFANVGAVYRDFFVLGDIVGQGVNATANMGAIGSHDSGIHWSAAGNPTSWPQIGTQDAIDNLSDFHILTGDGGRITAIVTAREYALVFQEHAVWRMDFVGGQNIFEFRLLDHHRGCVVIDGAVSVGGQTYFPSSAGWMMCDGASIQNVGLEKVDRTWRGLTNLEQARNLGSTAFDPERKIIWWCFPNERTVYGFHIELKKWVTLNIPTIDWIFTAHTVESDNMDSPGDFGDSDMDANASVVEPIDLGDVLLDTLGGLPLDEVLGCFLTSFLGQTFTNQEAPLVGTIGGGDFASQESRRQVMRNVRPIAASVSTGALQLRIDRRLNPMDELLSGVTKNLNSKGRIPYRVRGRYLRPFFTMTGPITQFRGFEPVAGDGGGLR